MNLRTPTAVGGAVAAISPTACALTAPPAAHTTDPGPMSTMANSAAPAHHLVTASPSAPAQSGGTAAVTIAAVGDTMLGSTPDLPPYPAAYLDPVKFSQARSSESWLGRCPPVVAEYPSGSEIGAAARGEPWPDASP